MGTLSVAVEGLDEGSVSGATRGNIVEAMEDTRSLLLAKAALATSCVRVAGPSSGRSGREQWLLAPYAVSLELPQSGHNATRF